MTSEQTATRKIRLRVMLPLTLLLILSSLDRSNVSVASLQMNAELGLSPKDYGAVVSSFFVGYLLFQFPSIYLLNRLGARLWVFALVLVWGVVASAMTLAHDATTLHALRLVLGIAEAGFAPGVVYLCSRWMPRRFRAGAIGMTLLAVPVSVIVGGPFSGWLMSHGSAGFSGWRWMFLVEGLLTAAFAVLAYLTMVDGPDDAKWLSDSERTWLKANIDADDRAMAEGGTKPARNILADGRLWAAGAVWFVLIAGAYGILFWLPLVVKHLARLSVVETSVVSALPWIGIGLGMIVNARHSDRTGERVLHVFVPMLVCSACLFAATTAASNVLALALLFVAGVGLGAAQSVFWTIPTSFLGKSVAGRGITAINLLGNIGGLVGPYAIGLIRETTGSFEWPARIMAASILTGSIVLLAAFHRGAVTTKPLGLPGAAGKG